MYPEIIFFFFFKKEPFFQVGNLCVNVLYVQSGHLAVQSTCIVSKFSPEAANSQLKLKSYNTAERTIRSEFIRQKTCLTNTSLISKQTYNPTSSDFQQQKHQTLVYFNILSS